MKGKGKRRAGLKADSIMMCRLVTGEGDKGCCHIIRGIKTHSESSYRFTFQVFKWQQRKPRTWHVHHISVVCGKKRHFCLSSCVLVIIWHEEDEKWAKDKSSSIIESLSEYKTVSVYETGLFLLFTLVLLHIEWLTYTGPKFTVIMIIKPNYHVITFSVVAPPELSKGTLLVSLNGSLLIGQHTN